MSDKKKKKKKSNIGKIMAASASSLVGIVIVAAVGIYFASGTLQGKLKVWMWKGNDTLRCSGNQVIKINGKTAHLGDIVIYAGGRCKVTLDKVDFRGRSAVHVSGNAVLTVRNSTLHGTQSHGIYVSSGARATVENSKVFGKSAAIYVGSRAEVTVKGGVLTSDNQGLYVGSDGSLRLEDVKVKGKRTGIYVGSKAEVKASGGVVEGKKKSLYVGTEARVTLRDTKTLGKLYTGRGATVTGRKFDKIRDTIVCKGTTEMTLKDKKVKLRKLVIDASGHCKIKLINCDLTGRPAAIKARDHAQIHLVGGALNGKKHSVLAYHYSIILVSKETKLVKKVGVAGDLVVVSRPTIDVQAVAAQLEGLATKEKAYKKGACDDLLACFKQNRSFGRYDLLVYMTPNDKGKITKVDIKRLKAKRKKRKVKKCILEAAREKTIEGFEGPAGKLWCRTYGSISGFMESVSTSSGFQFTTAPKPKGIKPLDLPVPK